MALRDFLLANVHFILGTTSHLQSCSYFVGCVPNSTTTCEIPEGHCIVAPIELVVLRLRAICTIEKC